MIYYYILKEVHLETKY